MNRTTGLLLGFILFGIAATLPTPPGMSAESQRVAAVALLMASWWVTEAIPISTTALLPLALFPLLGIMSSKDVSSPYANHNIFLFMGGFFIAISMEKWNLHKRIALHIIQIVGYNLKGTVLGFMIATAFLSMWISNTATTMMMLPIGLAVIRNLKSGNQKMGDEIEAGFGYALMIGIAYAASIGGVGTLIGTPPNIVFANVVKELYPAAPEITFTAWMKIGIPFVLIFLPLVWLYIVHFITPLGRYKTQLSLSADTINDELSRLGPLSRGEWATLIVFVTTALMWLFRSDFTIGRLTLRGWSSLFPWKGNIHDSTVAMIMGISLFLIPIDSKKGKFVMEWDDAKRIPWGIILLFGGGFALAKGFRVSGLDVWIGNLVGSFGNLPPLLLVVLTCMLITFLTELTSNTATTNMILPILGSVAVGMSIHPYLVMIPATLSASCAFMLPVATPPNAIVFGSGYITIPRMARTGFFLNIAGILIVTLLVYFFALRVFDVIPYQLPVWAK